MKVIGLTGGTGSGKSTIALIAKELGAGVIDADKVAREVVQKGQRALDEIVEAFGRDILLDNGELDRKKLGRIVFSDTEKLMLLNNITHKYIIDSILQKIKIEESANAYNVIMIDAAIIIESDLYKKCDEVWVVVADREERVRRIMERDRLSRVDAENRIASQMPDDIMKQYASIVIYNSSDIESVRKQIQSLMQRF